MSYREIPVNFMLDVTLSLASALGLKQRVDLSDHSISIDLTNPDKDNRAWDTNLYRNGNVFVDGYANPIKPQVNHNEQLEDPNTIDVGEGDVDPEQLEDVDEDEEDAHVSLISSSRYRDYMRQDLISQLLTPKEQWKLLAYGILGVGVLQFVTMVVIVYATGGF